MSFSAEMKDFLGAWQAGTKINASQTDADYKNALTDAQKKKTERENDPDTLELEDKQARATLAKTNAGIALTQEQIKNAGTNRAYTTAITGRMLKGDTATPGTPGYVDPNLQGAVGPTSGGFPQPAGDITSPIQTFAQGGVIPETPNDAEDDSDEDDTPAGPAVGGVPPGAPTDVSARARTVGKPAALDGVVSPQLVHDAVKGGYRHLIDQAGISNGVRTPRQQAAAKAIAQGAGALSQAEMDLVKKAVDPQGKMTESQRNMAAIGSAYQFYANRGEPQRAEAIAGQMLQHFRIASQRYAALAAHAAEQGNMDLATKAAMKAYANVPDGRDMTMSVAPDGHVLYHYVDENGKTINKGLATPQELASSAMGLARGGFEQTLLSAAGVREEQAKAATEGTSKGNPVTDMKNTQELFKDPVAKLTDDWQKKNPGKEVDQNYIGGLQDAATHIMQQNPKMTPREALSSAQALMDPKQNSFKTVSENGQNKIKFGDGTALSLDDDHFEALINKRAEARKAQYAAEDQAKADASKPSRMGEFVEGAKRAGSAIGNLAGEATDALNAPGRAAGEAIKAAVPDELAARGKSAIGAVGQAASDFAGRVANPDNIPAVAAYKGVRDANYGALADAVKTGVQTALQRFQSGQGAGAIPSTPDDNGPYQPFTGP
jgi:hypothetical protein